MSTLSDLVIDFTFTVTCFVGGASQLFDFPTAAHWGDIIHINNYALLTIYANKRTKNLKKWVNAKTVPLVAAYFALGETLIDWVPGNVQDPNDVYACVAGGVLGYLYSKRHEKDDMWGHALNSILKYKPV